MDWLRDILTADDGSTAYRQGKEARRWGQVRDANPYAGGLPRAQWFLGWEAAS